MLLFPVSDGGVLMLQAATQICDIDPEVLEKVKQFRFSKKSEGNAAYVRKSWFITLVCAYPDCIVSPIAEKMLPLHITK